MVELKVEIERAYVRGITVDQLATVVGEIEAEAKQGSPEGAKEGISLVASEGDEGRYEIALSAEKEALPIIKRAVERKIQEIPARDRYWYIGILGALAQEIEKNL